MSEEWRVEVELDDDGHGFSLSERLRALDLDDEAREKLGDTVIVTRDDSRLYLYAVDEAHVRTAEGVIAGLVADDDLTAAIRVAHWSEAEEDWIPADEPLPQTSDEIARAKEIREINEREDAAEDRAYDWVIRAEAPSRHQAVRFAGQLKDDGLDVGRRWKYVFVGVATESDARELAAHLKDNAPEGTTVSYERNVGIPDGRLVFWETHKPEIIRDLGL